MAKKSKVFRGQRKDKNKNKCQCFKCIGYDKHDLYKLKINNFFNLNYK